MSLTCLLTPVLLGAATSSTTPIAQQSAEAAAAAAELGSIADVMRAPLVDDTFEEGVVWVRTRSMRARFDAQGGAIYPVFGVASPQRETVPTPNSNRSSTRTRSRESMFSIST